MIVRVVDREATARMWGQGRVLLVLADIETSDRCPKCGGPRGTSHRQRFCEDGEYYEVDCWANPCGHVDSYHDVILDGRRLDTVRVP